MFLRRTRAAVPTLRDRARTTRRGEVVVQVGPAIVQELLDEFGLQHGIDDDGDITVRWESYGLYFFFYGDNGDVLQARMYLNRRFSVDDRAALALVVDEWNRTRLFGKAYTVLPDDGMVALCAEETHDFEGVTREQMTYAVATWIDALVRFAEWADEQI